MNSIITFGTRDWVKSTIDLPVSNPPYDLELRWAYRAGIQQGEGESTDWFANLRFLKLR